MDIFQIDGGVLKEGLVSAVEERGGVRSFGACHYW